MLACLLVEKSGDALGWQHLRPLKKEMLLMLLAWLRMGSGKVFGHHSLLRLGKFVFHARWLAGGEVWGRHGPANLPHLRRVMRLMLGSGLEGRIWWGFRPSMSWGNVIDSRHLVGKWNLVKDSAIVIFLVSAGGCY